ncbi:unnamed protein product [Phytophthora fragariaefolia]|uniref:Unnamed protein product n=1 Tax=Phytophthora fragariaefolia TaxID=1490495 RepID=A0A9W7D9P7_9STRA|nr:unnamed protein product [Phytophthora fragariaefolia]
MEASGGGLPTTQDSPLLTDAHWATLEKMVSLLGEAAFAGFPSLSTGQQRAWNASITEAECAAQASATNTASFAARPTTTKPVKMSVPAFDGKESDILVFWAREVEIALSAGQIYDACAQVAFALSNLAGHARAWAMAREMATPGYVTSWSLMEQELRSTFPLAIVAYRHRSNRLRCKQDKRSLQDYVMELHNLEAAMAGPPLSEAIKVAVFMDGVRKGPVRMELFRRHPKTFNEAVHIAMLEDHCVRSAQGHTPQVEASECPTPMAISLAESARPQRTQRAGGGCFGCYQPGHFRRNCPTNPWKATRDKKHPVSPTSLHFEEVEFLISHSKVEVPGTTLLCLSVVAARYNLLDVTASVKGYPEPMTALIDSGASFNFATKGSVAKSNALYASALEASERNTNVSVRLVTGSIVSTRKPEVGDGENPWNPNTSPMGRQGSAVCDRVASVRGGGGVTAQGADAATARAGRGGSVRAPPTQSVVAGSAHAEECAAVVARANKSGRVGKPTTQGVVAGSARATEGAGACARVTMSGGAGAPTGKIIRGGKVRSTPKTQASNHDADSVDVDRVSHVIDVFMGKPTVGKVQAPLPTKDLRKWLGLTNYLHKYSANYAEMARPLTNLLKNDAVWSWTSEVQQAFEVITSSLQSAPILALPDED